MASRRDRRAVREILLYGSSRINGHWCYGADLPNVAPVDVIVCEHMKLGPKSWGHTYGIGLIENKEQIHITPDVANDEDKKEP